MILASWRRGDGCKGDAIVFDCRSCAMFTLFKYYVRTETGLRHCGITLHSWGYLGHLGATILMRVVNVHLYYAADVNVIDQEGRVHCVTD